MENQLSNERLCELIRQGHDEYLLQLWMQCEKFIRMKAEQYVRQYDQGMELADDCVQEAYIALPGIVSRFSEERGTKFLTFLGPSLHSAFRAVMLSGRGAAAKDPLNNCGSIDQPLIDSNGNEYSLLDVVADDHAEEELHEVEEDDYRRSQNAYIRDCIELASDEIGKAILTEMLESNCGYRDAIVKLYGPEAIGNEQYAIKLRRRKAYAVNQIRQRSKHGVKQKLMRKYSLEDKASRSGLRGYGLSTFRDRGFVSEVECIVLGDMDKESE